MKTKRKAAVIISSVIAVSVLFALVGTPEFYERCLGAFTEGGSYGFLAPSLYQFAASFVLFLVLPFIVITRLLNEKPADYGWRRGSLRNSLITLYWAIPLVFVLAWISSTQPEFQKQYPLFISSLPSFPLRGQNVTVFILYEFTYLFYYVGFEFFFRGFALNGLKPALGKNGALFVQALISTLLHYNKPLPELIAAFPGGILFGLVALHCRSLFPVIAAHWLLGFFLDLFILLRA